MSVGKKKIVEQECKFESIKTKILSNIKYIFNKFKSYLTILKASI